MLARELRTPRERTLFVLSAIVSTVAWLAMLISVIGIPYAIVVWLFGLVVHNLFIAHVTGNGVRVGSRQLPGLMTRIEAAARKLGMDRVPEAYVVQSGGLLNAFATKLLSRHFIIIFSDLLEACESDEEPGRPNELDFVIGHELGHLAAGHLAMRSFLLPSRLVPLLGAAYSRACEYTCDRCGAAVVADVAVGSRALAILAAGPRAARRMNLDAYVEQRREASHFWMAVYELNATHPFLSKRVAALHNWEARGTAAPLGRNPLAYPLAPFLGIAIGAPASAVILIVFAGIAAALAVPRIKQRLGMGAGAGSLLAPREGSFYDLDKGAAEPIAPLPRAAPDDEPGPDPASGSHAAPRHR